MLRSKPKRWARRQRGQVAVEAAIVMPLHLFLMLGLIQLFLCYQAKLLTKYAAYKAVRAGAMMNASVSEMEKAATLALLPMIAEKRSGADVIMPTLSAGDALGKWARVYVPMQGGMLEAGGQLKHATVTICGPRRGEWSGRNEVDFDDPRNASASVGSEDDPNWRRAQATKLRAQVTFYYRMPIPFANHMWFAIARGLAITDAVRMGRNTDRLGVSDPHGKDFAMRALASQGIYVMPIRANYTMRMQSNIFVNQAPLPDTNECVIPWSVTERNL